MMSKAKSTTLAVAVLSALALVAGACGKGAPGQESGGGGGGTTLVIWHMEKPPNRVQAWQKIIDQFNASHQDVHVVQQPQDWNKVYSKIAGAAQSDSALDVLFTIPDFTTYVRSMGIVQPVTDMVNRLDDEHHFLKSATAMYRDKGQYWAVPLYGMIQLLWYRKDMLRKAGIDSAPKTWDQFEADAAKLTHGDQHGIALPAGKNLASDQVIYSLMITNNAERLYDKNGDIAFDNPRTVETFKLYNDLLKYSPPDSASYSWGEPQAELNNGSVAMAIEKGQYLGPFQEESGQQPSDLGCAPIPQPSGGQPGSIYYPNAAMVLTKDKAKQHAAEEFFSYILQPKVYGKFLNAEPGLFLPVTEDGMHAKTWRRHPVISTYQHCVNVMLKQSRSGQLFGFADGAYHMSIGKISGQDIIAQVIQRVYVNHWPVKKAVTWGQQQMVKAAQG